MTATKERLKTLQNFSDSRSLGLQNDVFPKLGQQLTKSVIEMLGESNKEHCVFRDRSDEAVQTICVGIFDLRKRTWSLYKDNPKTNEPLVVLPLTLQK